MRQSPRGVDPPIPPAPPGGGKTRVSVWYDFRNPREWRQPWPDLYRETLVRQPKAIQRFLRRTAVLDQLSGPLCEAVLGSSAAAIQLRRIEAADTIPAPLALLAAVAIDQRFFQE